MIRWVAAIVPAGILGGGLGQFVSTLIGTGSVVFTVVGWVVAQTLMKTTVEPALAEAGRAADRVGRQVASETWKPPRRTARLRPTTQSSSRPPWQGWLVIGLAGLAALGLVVGLNEVFLANDDRRLFGESVVASLALAVLTRQLILGVGSVATGAVLAGLGRLLATLLPTALLVWVTGPMTRFFVGPEDREFLAPSGDPSTAAYIYVFSFFFLVGAGLLASIRSKTNLTE